MVLLTVEPVGNQRVQIKGALPWLVRWASRAFTKIFVQSWLLLAALLSGQYKIYFSSPCSIPIPLSPSPTKLGSQPCWVAFLLVCFYGSDQARSSHAVPSPSASVLINMYTPENWATQHSTIPHSEYLPVDICTIRLAVFLPGRAWLVTSRLRSWKPLTFF